MPAQGVVQNTLQTLSGTIAVGKNLVWISRRSWDYIGGGGTELPAERCHAPVLERLVRFELLFERREGSQSLIWREKRKQPPACLERARHVLKAARVDVDMHELVPAILQRFACFHELTLVGFEICRKRMKRGCNAGAAIALRVRWRQTLSVNGRTGIIHDVLCEVVQVARFVEIVFRFPALFLLAANGPESRTMLANHALDGALHSRSNDVEHAAEVVLVGEFDREKQCVARAFGNGHVDALEFTRRLPNVSSWGRRRYTQ